LSRSHIAGDLIHREARQEDKTSYAFEGKFVTGYPSWLMMEIEISADEVNFEAGTCRIYFIKASNK
jgi:hypothetical protein